MFAADGAQLGIVTLAVRFVQNAAASQMVDGLAKSLAATTPHEYLLAFAALPGHWRSPAVSTEGIVVPLGYRNRTMRSMGAKTRTMPGPLACGRTRPSRNTTPRCNPWGF